MTKLATYIILFALSSIASAGDLIGAAFAKADRVGVYALDPRIRSVTKTSFPVSFGKKGQKTDVLNMKVIEGEEVQTLIDLLQPSLTRKDAVDFCGHFPTYGFVFYEKDKTLSRLTVCYLCYNWIPNNGPRLSMKNNESAKALLKLMQEWVPVPERYHDQEFIMKREEI